MSISNEIDILEIEMRTLEDTVKKLMQQGEWEKALETQVLLNDRQRIWRGHFHQVVQEVEFNRYS